MPTFFAPKGRFLKLGRIKFNNHLYTTSKEDEIKKIKSADEFGRLIFELPEGSNAADFIKPSNATLGPITTNTFKPHKSVEHFFQSKQLEILETESRMQANKDDPMLKSSLLHNHNKATLEKLCNEHFIEYSDADTRKDLIEKLKKFAESEG